MTKLARLMAQREGYGIPGAIPTTHNNPGDLRHSPHSTHTPDQPDAIGQIDSPDDGWADLERQLREFAGQANDHPGVSWTLKQMIYGIPDGKGGFEGGYAPPSENDSAAYLDFLCKGLGVDSDIPVAQALQIV